MSADPLVSPATLRPRISAAGKPLADRYVAGLTELKVERRLRVPNRALLRFTDAGFDLSRQTPFALDAELVISLGSDETEVFSGIVTGFEVSQTQRHGMLDYQQDYLVEAHDKSYRLAQSTHVRTLLNVKASEAVSDLATKVGLKARASATNLEYPLIMQTESDLAFLNALADRVGFDWYVDGDTLVFAPPTAHAQVALKLHQDLTSFRVRVHPGALPSQVVTHGWDPSKKEVIASKAGLPEQLQPESDFTRDVAAKAASGTTYATSVGVQSATEGDQLAKSLMDDLVYSAVSAQGSLLGGSALRPGDAVTVSDAGPASGTYYVSEVTTSFRPGRGLMTQFAAGSRRPRTLVDTIGRRDSSSFHHHGLLIGTVTNVKDPNGLGRVKVKLETLMPEVETDWARVASVGAGDKRGVIFLPEAGDEVLVLFENADPRRPIVVGGLWNGVSATPPHEVSDDGKVNSRRLASRLGHYLEYGDDETTSAGSYVTLALAGAATSLRLGADKKVDLKAPAGTAVSICAGQSSIKFDAQGNIAIAAPQIKLQATESVAISAPQQISASSEGQLSLSGTTSASLSGAAVSVTADATLTLSGDGMVQIN